MEWGQLEQGGKFQSILEHLELQERKTQEAVESRAEK